MEELQNNLDNTDVKFLDTPAFDNKRIKGQFCSDMTELCLEELQNNLDNTDIKFLDTPAFDNKRNKRAIPLGQDRNSERTILELKQIFWRKVLILLQFRERLMGQNLGKTLKSCRHMRKNGILEMSNLKSLVRH